MWDFYQFSFYKMSFELFSFSVDRCRSMLLVGDDSPHLDQVTEMNGRMDPQETDFVKVC